MKLLYFQQLKLEERPGGDYAQRNREYRLALAQLLQELFHLQREISDLRETIKT